MAEIVLGIGSSHGPLLSTPPEQWDLRAKADRENKSHWYRGKTYDYESLLKERAPGFANEIGVETRRAALRAVPASPSRRLARSSTTCRPDAVVIVGNDQREFFNPGPDAGHHRLSRQPGQKRAAPARRRAGPEYRRTWQFAGGRAPTIPAPRPWPITSSTRWPTRTSIWRSRMTRPAAPREAGFPTPTASCTTRFCGTRCRRACPSS